MFRVLVGLVLASGVGGLKEPPAAIIILPDLLGGPMGPRLLPTDRESLSSSSKL